MKVYPVCYHKKISILMTLLNFLLSAFPPSLRIASKRNVVNIRFHCYRILLVCKRSEIVLPHFVFIHKLKMFILKPKTYKVFADCISCYQALSWENITNLAGLVFWQEKNWKINLPPVRIRTSLCTDPDICGSLLPVIACRYLALPLPLVRGR